MPFPAIIHCIVCDDVREEKGDKLTIVGFYGASPHAIIVLAKVAPTELIFLVGTGKGKGTYTVSTRILGPDKSPITGETPITSKFNEASEFNNFICSFAPIAFERQGVHTFQFLVDGQVKYDGVFRLLIES